MHEKDMDADVTLSQQQKTITLAPPACKFVTRDHQQHPLPVPVTTCPLPFKEQNE